MEIICLHDKKKIWDFLQRDAFLHLYAIGDLDDFFWPYTTWYALMDNEQIKQLALVYTASSLPILLATSSEESSAEMQALLTSIRPFLPRRFYAHLNCAGGESLAHEYQLQSHGVHYQMALLRPDQIKRYDTSRVRALTKSDLSDLETLYRVSYPGNWFDPRMLNTGCYYGIREGGELLSIAGVHVYSEEYGVAALGNITTHPAYRGQQLAALTSAKLCETLLQTVKTVGLNVHSANSHAIACYSHLGFERVAIYEEFMCNSK